MRNYGIITVGQIIYELQRRGLPMKSAKAYRPTYYRKEQELNLPKGEKNSAGWRKFSKKEMEIIIKKILKDARIIT